MADNRQTALVTVRRELTSPQMGEQFRAALPAHITTEKFQRVLVTAVSTNMDLLNCDQRTLFAAAMKAAQVGLLPDGKEAALVAFGDKVQFMPMVAGVLKLIRNSGQLKSITAEVIRKNDEFDLYVDENGKRFKHRPDWFGDRGEVVGVYAHAVTTDGGVYIDVMSRDDVERIRAVSRSARRGPWVDWWDEMAKKTVIRRLAKYLPSSSDLDGIEDDDLEPFSTAAAPVQPVERDVTPPPAEDEPPRQRRIQAVTGGRREQAVEDVTPQIDEPPPITDDDLPL
jgi:recombination protein RecT